ncbi:phosphatidylglycerophosphatase A [Candidatus Dependentiae bacterium]
MIKKVKNFFIKLVATFGGVGYFPFFPGTAGSFVALGLFYLIPEQSILLMLAFLTSLFFVGVWSGGNVAKILQKHDPSIVVIDEVLGMGISLIAMPKIIWIYGLAFLIFRFFDISKIYPINKMEKVSGGWGIMLDDLLAGFFTLFVVRLVMFLVIKS